MSDELDRHLIRLSSEFHKSLQDDFELVIRRQGDQPTRYRLVLRPVYSRTGESWETDLSPAYSDPDELAAHMRGMSAARKVDRKAELFDPDDRPDRDGMEAEP